MRRATLPSNFEPQTLTDIEIPRQAAGLIEAARGELAVRAAKDGSDCWGYFPDRPGNDDLPVSRQFAEAWPRPTKRHPKYKFSWLRFSEGRPQVKPGYHLDTDKGDGLGGKLDNYVPKNQIWRVLINLHDSAEREFRFLNVDVRELGWQLDGSAINLAKNENIEGEERAIKLPPVIGNLATGVMVCVSRVAHAGMETQKGHFLASWSREILR